MGLLSSVVLIALVFVVVLAIAAASSAPQSLRLSNEFSPRIKTPGNLVETPYRAADTSGRSTSARSAYSHSAATPVKTPSGDRLAVPPVISAAGLQ